MGSADVVIGGGGIIGLTVALELARSGFHVRVLERGRAMTEASWAAAGMLAAEDPDNPPEITALAALSRNLYPEYLRLVQRLSARRVPLRTYNTLQATRLGGAFHCSTTRTRSLITPEEAERRVSGLRAGGRSFLWLEESSLDPRDLCIALPLAVVAAGVVLEENTEVMAVEAGAGSVAVTTSRGLVSAGSFVNCCGAWAGTVRHTLEPAGHAAAAGRDHPVRSSPDPLALSVVPRKGQMIEVHLDGPAQLQHVLRTPEIYLVPRGEGRIVIGATVERAGFDRQVEPAALQSLRSRAADLWPPIASAQVVQSWAGLRPGTSDDLPVIGKAGTGKEDVSNCWLATGHFRNGILLAPATGLLMRQLLQQQPPEIPLDAFAAER